MIPVKNIRQVLMCWALPSLRHHYKSVHFTVLLLSADSSTKRTVQVRRCVSPSPAVNNALTLFVGRHKGRPISGSSSLLQFPWWSLVLTSTNNPAILVAVTQAFL